MQIALLHVGCILIISLPQFSFSFLARGFGLSPLQRHKLQSNSVSSALLHTTLAFFLGTSTSPPPIAERYRMTTTTNLSSSTSPIISPSLVEFLKDRKQHPTSHFVVGNEAGDADSLISAIALSYVDDAVDPQTKKKTPLVSISRRDLETQRPETLFLLHLAGVSPEHLIYVDTAEALASPLVPSRLHFTLVDHNRLSNRLLDDRMGVSEFSKIQVVEILDHHLDEGFHSDTCRSRDVAFDPTLGVALVASTCTLVAEKLFKTFATPYPADVSLLLLGTILLDSVNLQASAGKVTPRDIAAVQSLLDGTAWSGLSQSSRDALNIPSDDTDTTAASNVWKPNTTALFDALQSAKFDASLWKGLSVRDALRLDYKQFTSQNTTGATVMLGVSTVLLSLEDFAVKAHVQDGIRHFMEEHNVHLLGIMLTCQNTDGHLQRQLMLCDLADGSFVTGLEQFLLAENTLQLTPRTVTVTSSTGGPYVRYFDQGNSKASRKQAVPILLKYYQQ